MADDDQVDPGQEPADTDTEPFDPARARAALEKRNRENQSLRARLKELEPLATKAREADEAAKTEAQKAAEAKTAAERERDEARLALLKRDVADDAGLPKAWASRLQGSTKEELEADAKQLAKDMPKPATSARPVADLRPGALPGERPTSASSSAQIDDWIRSKGRRQ